jgi:hypothetical protein
MTDRILLVKDLILSLNLGLADGGSLNLAVLNSGFFKWRTFGLSFSASVFLVVNFLEFLENSVEIIL